MTSRVLVVGSGAIGLRTAVELLRRNASVALRSSRPPASLDSCSVGAGGLWMPYHCDDPRVSRWAMETLDELFDEATLSSETSGVEIVPTVVLQRDHQGPKVKDFISEDYSKGLGGESPLPEWTTNSRLEFQHLTMEMLSYQNTVYKLRIPSEKQLVQLGYLHAWFFRAPVTDSPRKLQMMLEEVESHEKTISVETGHEYASLQDMVKDAIELDCHAVVNCTGIDAATLCGDTSIVGARGVILQYDRKGCMRREFINDTSGDAMSNDAVVIADEAPWGTETEPCYLIPRGNRLVVGGSYLEGDDQQTIRPEERKRLEKNAWNLGINVEESAPVAEWVGFRPARPTVRCEIDATVGQAEGVKVAHCYGHGGSGWTVNVGTAREVARLLGIE